MLGAALFPDAGILVSSGRTRNPWLSERATVALAVPGAWVGYWATWLLAAAGR
jgi:hypothetical protein